MKKLNKKKRVLKKGHPFLEIKRGEDSPSWKGQNVTYTAFHHWIISVLGKPLKCEICGVENLSTRHYDWSNKDHKYRRVTEDWQRLCKSCHKNYDNENILEKVVGNCLLCGKEFITISKKKKFCSKTHWTRYTYLMKKC